MLIGYGNYALSATIDGSHSGAAFLAPADGSALFDGRTGQIQSMQWVGGTQAITSYLQLTITIGSPLDTTAPQGVVGIANVIGLPLGTKIVIGSTTQRLVACARGELCAWFLPNTTGNTLTIKIYNDVGGSIIAGLSGTSVFAIGEIFVGRVLSLPSLIIGTNPTSDMIPIDPVTSRLPAGPVSRKFLRQVQAQLGMFRTADVKGGSLSSIASGGNPSGTIDVRTLRDLLLATQVCAVCDTPNAGNGSGTVVGGIRYDQDFMQPNWMIAQRPSAQPGQLAMTQPPLWSWSPQFQEAI